MPKIEKCAKYGLEVIQRAMVVDYSERGEQHLNVRIDADPEAIMFKQATRQRFVLTSAVVVGISNYMPKNRRNCTGLPRRLWPNPAG